MLRRRATGYRIRWLLGHSPGAVTGQNTVRLVAEYSCLALVLVITVSRLPNFDIGPLQWMLACVAAALVLELAVQMLRLRPILTTPRQEA